MVFQKKNGMDDNDNLVEYYKNNRYRKLNNTDEKSNEETINNYRLTKTELEKQLKIFLRMLKNFVILNLMMIYFTIFQSYFIFIRNIWFLKN